MGHGATDGDGCRCDDDGVLVIGEQCHADASRRVMIDRYEMMSDE